MKKYLFWILSLLFLISLIAFSACSNDDGGNESKKNKDTPLPTATQFISAKDNSLNSSTIGYDFKLSLNVNLSLGSFFSGEANGIYNGKYRYNKNTEDTKFMRTTSGLLLFDSTEYICTQGSTKVLIKMDDSGEVKKISTVPAQDEEITLINLPFSKIIESLGEDNISSIKKSNENYYKYAATVKFNTSNEFINKVLSILGKLGTNITIKDVTFPNLAKGFPIFFNINSDGVNNILDSYKIYFEVSFPIKAVNTTLTIAYEQKNNSSSISIPSIDNFTTSTSDISTVVDKINSAICSVKNTNAYSLDVNAKNEFDPGWNVTATTDLYKARLYKNTYTLKGESFTAFNHSYEYKTHHQEDGKENYKYTIGNIEDGSTYIVSRKGNNQVLDLPNVSANTQFDYLSNPFLLNVADIDCIKTVNNGNTTTYYLSINSLSAINVQEKINNYINSNNAEGVIKVNNYFNSSDNTIKSAIMEVTFINNTLKKVETKTEIKYFPTDGKYTDAKITLTDTLTLLINDKLNDAQDYQAPSSTGKIVGLASTEKYIL